MEMTPEIRAQYLALRAELKAAEAAVEPVRAAFRKAIEPVNELEGQIDELVGYVEHCETCDAPVFEDDAKCWTDEGVLCLNCSPTYEDMLRRPETFRNTDEEPMSPEEAKAAYDAHLANGGSGSDSVARSPVQNYDTSGATFTLEVPGAGWQFFNDPFVPMLGYEGKKWVCYFWNSGLSHISLGLHIDWHNPNVEIHLPFGFIRIGVRSEWRRAHPIVRWVAR